MDKKKLTATDQIKSFLSIAVGGNETDWEHLSKKRVYGGDISREYANKKTGKQIRVDERDNGLLCAHLNNEKLATGRLSLSGVFDKTAKPSAIDRVTNDMLEGREVSPKALRQAIGEGFAGQFKFFIRRADEDDDYAQATNQEKWERLWAAIYPAMRDSTFKCPSYIRPLVPGIIAVDECIETEYRFPAQSGIDTPSKMTAALIAQGLIWDEAAQKEIDAKLHKEIKSEISKKDSRHKNLKR